MNCGTKKKKMYKSYRKKKIRAFIFRMVLIMSIFFGGFVSGAYMFRNYGMQRVMDDRLKRLDLMKYDGRTDTFQPKDSLVMNKWDYYYIKFGKYN